MVPGLTPASPVAPPSPASEASAPRDVAEALGWEIRTKAPEVGSYADLLPVVQGCDFGGLLPRLVGYSVAAEIFFTGETLGADRLAELGLVSRVVPDGELLDAAVDLGRRIAANAPLAVRASKRMLRYGTEEAFSAHVQRVYLQLLPLFGTRDFKEGMASFMEKRPASFTGQ